MRISITIQSSVLNQIYRFKCPLSEKKKKKTHRRIVDNPFYPFILSELKNILLERHSPSDKARHNLIDNKKSSFSINFDFLYNIDYFLEIQTFHDAQSSRLNMKMKKSI